MMFFNSVAWYKYKKKHTVKIKVTFIIWYVRVKELWNNSSALTRMYLIRSTCLKIFSSFFFNGINAKGRILKKDQTENFYTYEWLVSGFKSDNNNILKGFSKEAGWSTNYPSNLPYMLDMGFFLAINY